jgi:hypothetical protein
MQSQFHFVIPYIPYIKRRIKFIQKISKRGPFEICPEMNYICPETTITGCGHPKQKFKIAQNNYFSKKKSMKII